MSLEKISDLLRARIGLDSASLGAAVLPSVVSARQRALHLPSIAAYAQRLFESAGEFATLVEELVVRETWFNRGGELFARLGAHIQSLVRDHPLERPVRVLSAPCSTGEEPYSLAMALTDLGVPRNAWRIDAVDISERFLERARLGRFADFSFRQLVPAQRERYFRRDGAEWEIDARLGTSVHFRQTNLLDPACLADEQPYDLILCRNLLIYLHDAGRRQVIATLNRLLAPAGLLAMGHAEPINAIDARFVRAGADGDFLFQRGPAVNAPIVDFPSPAGEIQKHGRDGTVTGFVKLKPTQPRSAHVIPIHVFGPAKAAKLETSASTTDDVLIVARQHADAGRLDLALACGEAHLAAAGPSAEIFTLLGLVQAAGHDWVASRRSFEKALYLEPEHHEALLHLLLLCQQEGDEPQATLLRRRLRRIEERGMA